MHRIAGVALILLAVMMAFGPDYPLSRERRRELKDRYTAAAIAAAEELAMTTAIEVYGPVGDATPDERFAWVAGFATEEWRVVLLSENREELAWSKSLEATSYRPEGEFQDALARKGTFYWYALAQHGDRQVQSEPVRIQVR